jgi:F-type H+-transporting ATPase subunit b
MVSLNITLIVQVVNFLLLMWILNRILFRPILKVLEEREEKIGGPEKTAQDLETQAQGTRGVYEAKMRQAQIQASEAREGLRREGAEEAKRMVERISSDAEKSLAETREVVAREAVKVRSEFERLGSEISLEIFRKIIRK